MARIEVDMNTNVVKWPIRPRPYAVFDGLGPADPYDGIGTSDPTGFMQEEVEPTTWKDAMIIAREWWVSQAVWKRSLLFGGTCSAVILTLAWFAWRAA